MSLTILRTKSLPWLTATLLLSAFLFSEKANAQAKVPLKTYWSTERTDNYLSSGEQHGAQALREGYRLVRTEACILTSRATGTVALETFYSRDRKEHFSTATDRGKTDAQRAGYGKLRTEGYVYKTNRPGLVPLVSYWSAERLDNFSTATLEGRRSADGAKYTKVRIEGYVYPASQCGQTAQNQAPTTAVAEVLTATAKLPTFVHPETFRYTIEDDLLVYQGDIILGSEGNLELDEPAPELTKRSFREFGIIAANPAKTTSPLTSRVSDGIINRNWLWPKGIIPYKIDRGDFSGEEIRTIEEAIDELNRLTNLNIVPKWRVQHHVKFVKNTGMNAAGRSRIGRTLWPMQRIQLNRDVPKDVIIHELLHAAGVWHEQSRADRNRHIEILWDNIQSGVSHNFDRHISDGRQVTPYDANSIMHYPGFAFSKNGQPTIIDRETGLPVSPARGLSQIDIDGLNTLYPVDYYTGASRPIRSLRQINVEVNRIQSDDRDGGRKHDIDFYLKAEIGEGWDWRPGNRTNPTEKFKSRTIEESDNDISPDWKFTRLLPVDEPYAKIWLKLRDDDGRSGTEGGISPDETVDINPFPDIKHLELYIDTGSGEIFLGDVDGARSDENFIGSLGEDIELEGFQGDIGAYIDFKITVTEPSTEP